MIHTLYLKMEDVISGITSSQDGRRYSSERKRRGEPNRPHRLFLCTSQRTWVISNAEITRGDADGTDAGRKVRAIVFLAVTGREIERLTDIIKGQKHRGKRHSPLCDIDDCFGGEAGTGHGAAEAHQLRGRRAYTISIKVNYDQIVLASSYYER